MGVTGQDGGYLAERLARDGLVVHGVCHDGEPGAHLRRLGGQLVLHRVDIVDSPSVRSLVESVAPQEIYNLAGATSVAGSWTDPPRVFAVNSVGAAAVLDAAWRGQEVLGRPVRVVQAVSAEIFAGADVCPQDETSPVRPTTPYGASKAAAHQLAGIYRGRGLPVSSLILYNHESPRRAPHFVTRKIALAAASIACGEADGLVLGNLEARRDWGWAPEYVDAMVAAARADDPDDYVVATGQSHSVGDFAAAAFAAAGLDWAQYVRSDPALLRPGDAVELVGDATKAAARLGWQATIGLAEIARRMVEHDLAEARSAAP